MSALSQAKKMMSLRFAPLLTTAQLSANHARLADTHPLNLMPPSGTPPRAFTPTNSIKVRIRHHTWRLRMGNDRKNMPSREEKLSDIMRQYYYCVQYVPRHETSTVVLILKRWTVGRRVLHGSRSPRHANRRWLAMNNAYTYYLIRVAMQHSF